MKKRNYFILYSYVYGGSKRVHSTNFESDIQEVNSRLLDEVNVHLINEANKRIHQEQANTKTAYIYNLDSLDIAMIG